MPMPASTERPRFRGAIIGSGGIARHAHLPAFRDVQAVRDRIEIVAFVDAAQDLAPVDGIPQFRHVEQLRDLAPIDFIDVCTPTASHLDLTLWGLASGYHVLCEKPVALTRDEAGRIRHAARHHDRVVMPCHQYRFNPVWRRIQQWLESGVIGRWHLAEYVVHRPAADPGIRAAGPLPWRGRLREGRGGVLLDHGTHFIYQLLDLAGLPASVTAWTGRVGHPEYEVEDTASVVLAYPDRAATMFLTWAGARRHNEVRIVGERGSIEWVNGELRLEAGDRRECVDVTGEVEKSVYHRWFARLFERFANAMDTGDGPTHLDDIEAVAGVLEAAYASARSGHSVLLR